MIFLNNVFIFIKKYLTYFILCPMLIYGVLIALFLLGYLPVLDDLSNHNIPDFFVLINVVESIQDYAGVIGVLSYYGTIFMLLYYSFLLYFWLLYSCCFDKDKYRNKKRLFSILTSSRVSDYIRHYEDNLLNQNVRDIMMSRNNNMSSTVISVFIILTWIVCLLVFHDFECVNRLDLFKVSLLIPFFSSFVPMACISIFLSAIIKVGFFKI